MLYLAVRHFSFFLEGRVFTAFVDHKPLLYAMSKVSEPWSSHQQRHLAFISEFTTDIKHIDGKSNVVANCLSRATVQAVHLGIDFAQLAADQQSDPDVQAYRTAISSLKIADIHFVEAGVTLVCDVSRGHPHPVVPVQWRRAVFDNVHSFSHPGRKASQKLVSSKVVWHGLKKDVRIWVSACVACQWAKAPLEMFEVPERRFDHVNIDLVGPLPPSRGFYSPSDYGGSNHQVAGSSNIGLNDNGRCSTGLHRHLGCTFRHTIGHIFWHIFWSSDSIYIWVVEGGGSDPRCATSPYYGLSPTGQWVVWTLSSLSQNCTEGQFDRWQMDWATALGSPEPANGSQGGSTNFLGRVGVWSDSAGPGRFHSWQHQALESIFWTLCPPGQDQYFQTHSYLSAWADGSLDA